MNQTVEGAHSPAPAAADVAEAYRACRAITRKDAKNFYYAFLTLPGPKRQAIYAAYAFCRMCDDIADEPDPDGDRARRLDDVRASLQGAYDGAPRGDVFTALYDAVTRYSIPQRYFEDVIKGVEMDLSKKRYATFDELREYCYYVASAVGLICIEVCAYSDPKAVEHAIDLGIAMQLTNILRDVGQDAAADRIYLPQEDLQRFGYSEDDLKAGVMNNGFQALMKFEADRARSYFASGSRLMPLLDRRARACPEMMAGIYRRILDRIEAEGFDVFGRRVGLSKPAKIALMARLWARSFVPTPF